MLKKLFIPILVLLFVLGGCGAKSDKEKAVELASKVVEFLKSDEGKDMFSSFEKANLFDNKVTELAQEVGFETRDEADSIMTSFESDEEVLPLIEEMNTIMQGYYQELYQ
ncbi:MAG: hypothetical protein JXA68_06545 [Ignavibacteriales bacterium]|nr:hypothetical protein [Ignavibacteriales bacterium]